MMRRPSRAGAHSLPIIGSGSRGGYSKKSNHKPRFAVQNLTDNRFAPGAIVPGSVIDRETI